MAEEKTSAGSEAKGRDEVALELMKFVAVTTGYGKGSGGAGFTGKAMRTPEEHAESLLELFQRCRAILASAPGDASRGAA
jgi:hypothetical protein